MASDAELIERLKDGAAKSALEAYLNGLGLGIPIVRTAIVATIPASLGATSNLRIKPVSWCPNPNEPIDETTAASYVAKFVEKPSLGNLFVYNAEVALDGALALVLPGIVPLLRGRSRTRELARGATRSCARGPAPCAWSRRSP